MKRHEAVHPAERKRFEFMRMNQLNGRRLCVSGEWAPPRYISDVMWSWFTRQPIWLKYIIVSNFSINVILDYCSRNNFSAANTESHHLNTDSRHHPVFITYNQSKVLHIIQNALNNICNTINVEELHTCTFICLGSTQFNPKPHSNT